MGDNICKVLDRGMVARLLDSAPFLESMPEFTSVANRMKEKPVKKTAGCCSESVGIEIEKSFLPEFRDITLSLPPDRLSVLKRKLGCHTLFVHSTDSQGYKTRKL